MSESNLKREFSKRDVQRMRNIITGNAGGSTGVQVGYSKQSQDYTEGDIWEENGKQWTIKNGIKQTVTKFDRLKKMFIIPIACPECSKPMKNDDEQEEPLPRIIPFRHVQQHSSLLAIIS